MLMQSPLRETNAVGPTNLLRQCGRSSVIDNAASRSSVVSIRFRRTRPTFAVWLKLIVEVDGEDHQTEEGRERDERRDRFLAARGYTVLRIPGYQVLRDPARVRCLIEKAIDERMEQLGPLTPSPSPPAS